MKNKNIKSKEVEYYIHGVNEGEYGLNELLDLVIDLKTEEVDEVLSYLTKEDVIGEDEVNWVKDELKRGTFECRWVSFKLELQTEFLYTDRMKNKNIKTAEGYTYQQVDEAAKVIQAYYTKLAERVSESNPKMSRDFNFIRLEMRNLRQCLRD